MKHTLSSNAAGCLALAAVLMAVAGCAAILSEPADAATDDVADSTASGTCGTDLAWTYADGVLTISGSGTAMDDYSSGSDVPWYQHISEIETVAFDAENLANVGDRAFYKCASLKSITIPDTVTDIGTASFAYCYGLTSLTIPSSVTGFSDGYCFAYCYGLTSVTFEDGVERTGIYTFQHCTGLTSVTMPDSVTSIDSGAFQYCTGLTSVTIPEVATKIGNNAFQGCTALTSITIPDTATGIGQYTFQGCTALTSATIGKSVESIGNNAFQGCTALTSITIPDTATSIGGSAFSRCTALTSATIGKSVESIGQYAFYGCTGLTAVTIPSAVTSIGQYVFQYCTALSDLTISTASAISSGCVYVYGATGRTVTVSTVATSASEIPDGMTFSDGILSGKPTVAGTYTLTFAGANDQTVTLTVTEGELSVTTANLYAVAGKDVSLTLESEGGDGEATWTTEGLPDGLSLSGNAISGTAPAVEEYEFTATATSGTQTATATVKLTTHSLLAPTNGPVEDGTVELATEAEESASENQTA